MTSAQVVPALVVSLFAWRIFMRFKRNIGRQRFEPKRVMTRIVILSVIVLLLGGSSAVFHPMALFGLAGGLAIGVPLAVWAVHLTRFEATSQGKFYTPNTHIGLAVMLIFVGRIVYRLAMLYLLAPTLRQGVPPQPSLFQSPLTLVCFGITAGYYVAYLIGVSRRMDKISSNEPDSPAPDSAR